MPQYRIILFGIAALYFVTVAVNTEVPLYGAYAHIAGYGSGITALAFALYIVGALPIMFFLGGISDHIGRKRVIIAGILCMIFATGIMVINPTIYTLCIARILQGIGFALSVPACTAYLSEMTEGGAVYAAKLVAIMTSLGFGSGSLFTSLALLIGHTLVPLSYWIVIFFLFCCIGLSFGLPDKKGEKGSLLRLPYYPPGTIKAGMAIAIAWAVSGIILTIVPIQMEKINLAVWVGLMLFLLNACGVILQPFARRIDSKKSVLLGALLVPLGFVLLLMGEVSGVLWLILLGSAIAGAACYGFTYLGSLSEVAKEAGTERARATSGYFFLAYIGLFLPSIFVGFIADKSSILYSLQVFGVVIVIASIVLAYTFKRSMQKISIR